MAKGKGKMAGKGKGSMNSSYTPFMGRKKGRGKKRG